jgi:hypothetical protein
MRLSADCHHRSSRAARRGRRRGRTSPDWAVPGCKRASRLAGLTPTAGHYAAEPIQLTRAAFGPRIMSMNARRAAGTRRRP